MARIPTLIELTEPERRELDRIVVSRKAPQDLVVRSRIILMCAQGMATQDIAASVGVRPTMVSKWRIRYAKSRLEGLRDAPRSGKPPKYGSDVQARILAKLEEPPPAGYARWDGELLAKALGDVSTAKIWRILRKCSVSLARRRSWCVSTDPEFQSKAADVVGLYLAPPENALVLCFDEKPGIQALERAQGWLKLPDGKALTGFSHEYKRHGTSNLYAALDIATGMVKSGHFKRKRKVDFMDFLDEALLEVPADKEVHIVLDNLSSHKNLPQRWHERHSNVTLHFTPTHASWLNQVETWFSILWLKALKGGSFRSVRELCEAIDRFIESYNETAHPFEWKRATTTPKTFSHSIANLCK